MDTAFRISGARTCFGFSLAALLLLIVSAGSGIPGQPSLDPSSQDDFPEPRTPCTSPAKFFDVTCLKPGNACANVGGDPTTLPSTIIYNKGLAVCRLKVYLKQGAVETLIGTCTGFNAQASAVDGQPRSDVVLTARHCVDR